MIEFIKEIVNGVVAFFTAGAVAIVGVISPSPTPTPAPVSISTSTAEVSTQNIATIDLLTVTPTPALIPLLTAKSQYSYRGKNVDIELSMPENGGKITGTIKGLCNGTIGGTYQKETNTITGTANGECNPHDDNEYYNSSGEFSGEVNLVDKVIRAKAKGRIYPTYFGKGGYITVGEMNLTLNIQ